MDGDEKVVGDIVVELEAISSSLNENFTALSEKQFYDKDLAITIKDTLEASFNKLIEQKNYDETLGEKISTAIGEAVSKISRLQLDVSPVMKIGLDMVLAVKNMVTAFVMMPKPENNDTKYQEMFVVLIDVIKKNNDLLNRIIVKQEAKVIDITPQKKLKIEFKVTKRDQYSGKIDTFLAEEK